MGLFSSVGSYFGNVFGGGNKKAETGWREQRQAYEDALNGLKGANVQSEASGMKNVKIDPRLRSAQMGALGAMQGEAARGGMGVEDKAALMQAQEETARQNAQQQGAIIQGGQARNTGGSSNTLASQLAAQQGTAQTNAMAGTQAAADARKRAMNAMAGAGEMGGKMEAQQFGEQAQAAQAQDAINAFNAGQRLKQATGVAGLGQKTGDIYAQQGQNKKQQNESTWGGGGSLIDSALSFLG